MKQILIIFILLTIHLTNLFAQKDSIEAKNKTLDISAYAEIYYQYDANRPLNNTRPSFVYSHNRNNEVNLNLAYIKAQYNNKKVRTNIAIATGSYMNANYTAEPGVLKNIYESNVGVKISKKHDLWIDAGILPSHLGFESAVGKDNWSLTRSLFADNSPYFETGAKISYTSPNGKLFVSGLLLNGWQRIQRADGNTSLALGHQLTYKPNSKITINSGSFIGNDKADSLKQMRYFHNFYAMFQVHEKFGLTIGFDIGAEQKNKGSNTYNIWYTPILLAKFNANNKLSFTARGEYYEDKAGVIITSVATNAIKIRGYSFNTDYLILPNLVWRTELKKLNSQNPVFLNRDQALTSHSFSATTALAISF